MMRRAACKAANPLKIRASLGLSIPASFKITLRSQSLKDQGKSRTAYHQADNNARRGRNPLKIRASLELKKEGKTEVTVESQSLKDQGKSRTLDSLAFARRQSFSLRKH